MLVDLDAVDKSLGQVFDEVGRNGEEFLRLCLDYVEREVKMLSKDASGVRGVVDKVIGEYNRQGSGSDAALDVGDGEQQKSGGNGNGGTDTVGTNEEEKVDEKGNVVVTLEKNQGNGADMEKYSWTQTLTDVAVMVPVPKGTKGKECRVEIEKGSLRVGLKREPNNIIEGELFAGVKPDDCLWNLVDSCMLEVSLVKQNGMQWWPCVIQGEPQIDTQQVEPEASKLSDLDPEMRSTVEKMMFDQQQKAMGMPTSEEMDKQKALEKFMAAHPEMDFSNAKIM